MDTSNCRPTQGASGAASDPTMESGDWRSQVQRQRTMNKIMDTLKRHLPFSGHEKLQELKKIAERVEEEIYAATTCQSEYSRKTCFMILTMETRLQSPMPDPDQSNSAANIVNPSAIFDSIAQSGNPNDRDWQEEVYQKIKAMKSLYLLESGDWRARLQANSRQRIVNKILGTLKKHVPVSRQEGLQELKKLAVIFEEKIYTVATSQDDYLRKISLKMLTMETRSQNSMSDQPKQSNSAAKSVNPSVPLDFTAQTGNPNGGDWQEEVYQKIKAMKDLYLLDLNNIQQRVISILQQHHSLPRQLKNEQLEKLKVYKNILERIIQYLQTPKHGILANHKDKLGTYEKQIINVINLNRQKAAAPQHQAQALPQPHLQSLQQSEQTQSQLTQVQSHANQMNLQGSMAQMLESKKMPTQQQNQQSSANLLPTQVQQSHPQLQQQVMPHMQQRPNQQQNVIDMPNRLCPQKRATPEHSSTSLDPTAGNPNDRDWQEEAYQKIKAMKELYALDLRPTLGASAAVGDPTTESVDWRAQLQADSRQRIVNKIMDTLKRRIPFCGHEGLQELKKIAMRFEEKNYTAAISQYDYLRKISLKMLAMENRSQDPMSDPMSDPMQSNSAANSVNPSGSS